MPFSSDQNGDGPEKTDGIDITEKVFEKQNDDGVSSADSSSTISSSTTLVRANNSPLPKDATKDTPFSPENIYKSMSDVPAGPSARKLARELGVDIRQVSGSRRGGRIDKQDVKDHAKRLIQSSSPASGNSLQVNHRPLPDFSEFGEVSVTPLTNIRKTISAQMAYSWQSIPHVHQTVKIDISNILAYQKKHAPAFKEAGSSLSVSLFVIKALSVGLAEFPNFNSSYDATKEELWLKKYFNIGVAVDTAAGLVVPVLKSVDKMTIFEIGKGLRSIAKKARERKLTLNEMRGACITVSNLGGLGAGHFTPIVNPPEVAIVGIAATEKILTLKGTHPHETPFLPLILGYDHRVIDGADAARFAIRLKELLEDPSTLLMGYVKPQSQ